MKRTVLAGVLLATLAVQASAAELEEPGVRFQATAAAEVVMAGGADQVVRPAVDVEIDGPLALGGSTPARVFTRLRVLGLPGQAVELGSVETFRAAEVTLGLYRRIGRVVIGDQEVWTSLEGDWGFATRLASDPTPAQRNARHYGGGLRVEERRSGAWLSMLYGRHEAAGDRGWGQWVLSGAVPLAVAKRAVVVGGDSVLSVGPPGRAIGQRDHVRVYVGVSLPDLIAAVR